MTALYFATDGNGYVAGVHRRPAAEHPAVIEDLQLVTEMHRVDRPCVDCGLPRMSIYSERCAVCRPAFRRSDQARRARERMQARRATRAKRRRLPSGIGTRIAQEFGVTPLTVSAVYRGEAVSARISERLSELVPAWRSA